MNSDVVARHVAQIYDRAYLLCIFERPSRIPRHIQRCRTNMWREKVICQLRAIVVCPKHKELPEGCWCPSEPECRNAGQPSHYLLTTIKNDATQELKKIMSRWPEWVRYRNVQDGPVFCLATGVDITIGDLCLENPNYNQDEIAELIRVFNCD